VDAGLVNFTHKTMTESSGPGDYSCRAHLDKLTELPPCYGGRTKMGLLQHVHRPGVARELRAEAANRERAARSSRQVVRFARPISSPAAPSWTR